MKKFPYALFCISLVLLGMAQIPGSAGEVYIGGDNFLRSDGEPFFVIGTYGMPDGITFAETKAMGFNLTRISANPDDWDNANKAGLKTWHSFGTNMDFDKGDSEKKKEHIQKIVSTFSSHPALLFWESMDEPAWTDKNPALPRATPQGLTQGRRFLHSLDSNHPVYLNQAPRNTIDTLRTYNSACDIVCVDIYPIIPKGLKTMFAITPDGRHGDLPNQTPSCAGEYVDKMKQVANANQAVFVVLQGFAWEGLRRDEAEPELILYPNYQESRFMAFNAITHGANGLMYWGLHYTPKDHPFLKDLSKVLNEINSLTPAILGHDLRHKPILRYHERGSSITSGIEIISKQTDSAVYLIASNTSIDPAAADFMALPPELASAKSIQVLGENRTVSISNGSFFDEFKGLDVHIYVYETDGK